MLLSGTLADGSPFEFELNDPVLLAAEDYFSANGILTVTRVSLLEGDYNSGGAVEQRYLDLVLLNWGEELFNPFAAGWINDLSNGAVDQEELDAVLLHWGDTNAIAATASVPEPNTYPLFVAAFAGFAALQRRLRRPVLHL